jgi:hypothetical protein
MLFCYKFILINFKNFNCRGQSNVVNISQTLCRRNHVRNKIVWCSQVMFDGLMNKLLLMDSSFSTVCTQKKSNIGVPVTHALAGQICVCRRTGLWLFVWFFYIFMISTLLQWYSICLFVSCCVFVLSSDKFVFDAIVGFTLEVATTRFLYCNQCFFS